MRLVKEATALNDRYPRLGPGVDPTRLSLTPVEGFLLSRIDGATSWSLLRSVGALPPDEIDRCLERWIRDRVIVVTSRDGRTAKSEAPREPVETAPPAPPAPPPRRIDRSEIDATLDVPIAVQERILEFEGILDRPYHEILGVAADADRKLLRSAYFALSRELHPDRFFRRNVGAFGKRLDRIFGKIVEAYELLSDPTARAEIERSLAAAAGEAVPIAQVAPTPQAAEGRSDARPDPEVGDARRASRVARRPHVFSLHNRMIRERKARAKRFFEAGMAAHASGRFTEAAGSVRLAIAFDPWNAGYKEHFVEVLRTAHDERAQKLMREADGALELRDWKAALRAFEEVLEYRPHDADLLRRAARLSLASGGELHQAKEWAMAAVELDGKDAASRRVLGQIYKAAGLEANARRELEAALALDPTDEEARTELRGTAGRSLGLRWLGGKG